MDNAAVALTRHLDSVARRDMAGFTDTVHPDAMVVLPTGERLVGKAAIIDFHKAWFTDPDWSQQLRLLTMTGDDAILSALYHVDYQDFTPQGEEIRKRYLLGLVFTKGKDGQWLLLHDQCTPLVEGS